MSVGVGVGVGAREGRRTGQTAMDRGYKYRSVPMAKEHARVRSRAHNLLYPVLGLGQQA